LRKIIWPFPSRMILSGMVGAIPKSMCTEATHQPESSKEDNLHYNILQYYVWWWKNKNAPNPCFKICLRNPCVPQNSSLLNPSNQPNDLWHFASK
jgi:hypothetical protein